MDWLIFLCFLRYTRICAFALTEIWIVTALKLTFTRRTSILHYELRPIMILQCNRACNSMLPRYQFNISCEIKSMKRTE